ncbi:ankyrin repeat-containing domain protein [Phyllosticta capitalensis]
MDIPDLWEQAKSLLREDTDTSDWQLFTSFQSDASPKEVLESIKKGQDRAQDRYKPHSVTIMSKKFEFHVGRIMKKMRTICSMVDSGMVYAPESASIVWSAFRTLTRVIFQDQELCELVSSTLDLMSEVVFVCDVHAHRVLRAVDWRKQRPVGELQTAPDTGRKILEKIPLLYKIVLKFSFETTKLFPLDHEGNPKTKITRAVKAFFGKTDELSGLLDEAKSQLAQLHQMADIDFKIAVEDTVKETNLDMKEIKELWLPGIASEVENISGELAKSKEETELKRLDEECNTQLNWLKSGTSLALSQPKDQQVENLKNRSPNTCKWIFERGKYNDWELGTGKRTFWLSGPAGVGKSFLSSSVIEELDSGDIDGKKPLVVFFFCKVGNDATQKGKKIMLHLLLQLFNEACNLGSRGKANSNDNGKLKRACIDIVKGRAEKKDAGRADDLRMSKMTQMFADIMEHLGRRIFIILDALDECVDWAKDESGLLHSLIYLTSKESSTSLFISSRVNGDIETSLSIPRHRIQVDKSANEEDIGRFVDHELGQKEFDFLKKKVKENARSTIMAKSEGMFQYAVIAIKTLNSAQSKANFRKAVNQLPHGINKLYAKKFEDLEEEPRNHSRIILRWLVCAKGAIQAAPIVDEIGEYYSSEYEEDDDDTDDDTDDDGSVTEISTCGTDSANGRVISSMKSLMMEVRDFVEFDSTTGVVSLNHKSIKDWILDEATHPEVLSACPACNRELANSASTLQIAPKHGHFHLACNMLQTLNNPRFQKKYLRCPEEGHKHPSTSHLRLSEEEEGYRYELNRWTYHVRMAEQCWPEEERERKDVSRRWEQLYEDIDRFMSSKAFRSWEALPTESPIHFAAWFGLLGTLRRLVDGGEDLNKLDEEGRNLLHLVCRGQGDYVGLEYLLANMGKSQINLQGDREGGTPLMTFLRGDPKPTRTMFNHVRALLKHGADPGIPKRRNYTCLMYAAAVGHVEIFREILAAKELDVNVQDDDGSPAFHWLFKSVSRTPSFEIAKLLIDQGAHLETNSPLVPLVMAAQRGSIEIVRLLLSHGVGVNEKDYSGATALHEAVRFSNLSIVELSVDHGADIIAPDNDGRTPILVASTSSSDILEYLLEQQISRSSDTSFLTKAESRFGESPLHCTARRGCVANVQLLLKSGQPVVLCSRKDKQGWTPLHTAAWSAREDVVKILIQSGSDLSAVDEAQRTAVDLRIWGGLDDYLPRKKERVIDILLSAGAKVTRKPDLLEMAIEVGMASVCRHLTGLASDFDTHGWNPLLLAFVQQEQHISEMLSFFDTSGILVKLANIGNAGIGFPPTSMWHPNSPLGMTASAEQPTTVYVTEHFVSGLLLADHPVPAGISHYYFELFIERGWNSGQEDVVSFGFCSKFYSGAIQSRPFSGWMYLNWGRAFEDTHNVHCTEQVASFGKGDTVGVGVDFRKHVIFFTKNGEKLEGGFHGDQIKGRLFPFVHMSTSDEGAQVRVNFGSEPFKYQWSLLS